jgi:Spy/CpxP family protein refolding chaperone
MNRFTKCAAIAGIAMLAAGSAAWAQAYNANPGTPGPYAVSPGTQGPNSGQTAGQATQGLTTFERAKQELRKAGYKDSRHWKQVANGWSADATRNGQNVHVIVGDNGQIATSPAP